MCRAKEIQTKYESVKARMSSKRPEGKVIASIIYILSLIYIFYPNYQFTDR